MRKTLMWSFKLDHREERRWLRILAYGENGSHGHRLSDIMRRALNELYERQVREGIIEAPAGAEDHWDAPLFRPVGSAEPHQAVPVVQPAELPAIAAAPDADTVTSAFVEHLARAHDKGTGRPGRPAPKKTQRNKPVSARIVSVDLFTPRDDDAHKRPLLDMQPDEIRAWATRHGHSKEWAETAVKLKIAECKRRPTKPKSSTSQTRAKAPPPASGQTKAGKNGRPKKGKV